MPTPVLEAALAAGPNHMLYTRLWMASPVHGFGQPKAREDVVTCEVAGTEVDAVVFQQGEGKIYVDGSAFSPTWPEIASAGLAAVQVHDRVLGKTIKMALSDDWPQTAAAAERVVLPLVQLGSQGQHEVATDCKGVSTGWAKLRSMAQANAGSIGSFSWTKAHKDAEQCTSDQEMHDWVGNIWADGKANEAARMYRYEKEQL